MKQQATATSNEQNEYLPSNSRGYSLELAPDLSPASKILTTVGEILPIMHQISEKWICGGPVPHCDDLVRELRDWEERQRTRKSEVGDLQLHIPTERGHFFPVMRKSELLKQKNEGAQLVEARKTYSHSHPSPIIFDLKWNFDVWTTSWNSRSNTVHTLKTDSCNWLRLKKYVALLIHEQVLRLQVTMDQTTQVAMLQT